MFVRNLLFGKEEPGKLKLQENRDYSGECVILHLKAGLLAHSVPTLVPPGYLIYKLLGAETTCTALTEILGGFHLALYSGLGHGKEAAL